MKQRITQKTQITSQALHTNATFPFVTMPDFELIGSHLRQQLGSHVVHWLPLVKDEDRQEWEEYAFENRHHIEDSFRSDTEHRTRQDELLGVNMEHRALQQQQQQLPMSVLDDGSEYHTRIWSNGATVPRGDMPEGSGPFLPAWQRR